MAEVKLTKSGLRQEQMKLQQLHTYLPTLQLKKAMLQAEVFHSQAQIQKNIQEIERAKKEVLEFSLLLSDRVSSRVIHFSEIRHVQKHYENVAGVEIPVFEQVVFQEDDYLLFDTPPWIDTAVVKIRVLVTLREKLSIEKEKKRALEKELRDVSIRVNLFEKILIPRSLKNIHRIKIFLGDQQLTSISQAKIAKAKIEEKRKKAVL
jgi:V/A-type H+-transporting ATPase subunit D